jgi:hypothetical protein
MRLVKRESNQFIDKRLRVCVLCFGILTILPQYFLLLASERSLMTGVICEIIESLGFLEEETKEILSRLPQGAPYPTAKPEKQAALSRCTPISLLISKFSTVDVSLGQDQIGRCAWARPKQERTSDAVKAPLLEGANHRRCRTCVQ